MTAQSFTGLGIGLATFLIIGMFHPLVIKSEYYFGVKSWWAFLFAGIGGLALSLTAGSVAMSALWGVFAFSCFWSIGEIFEQRKRVERGWFPANEKRLAREKRKREEKEKHKQTR